MNVSVEAGSRASESTVPSAVCSALASCGTRRNAGVALVMMASRSFEAVGSSAADGFSSSVIEAASLSTGSEFVSTVVPTDSVLGSWSIVVPSAGVSSAPNVVAPWLSRSLIVGETGASALVVAASPEMNSLRWVERAANRLRRLSSGPISW